MDYEPDPQPVTPYTCDLCEQEGCVNCGCSGCAQFIEEEVEMFERGVSVAKLREVLATMPDDEKLDTNVVGNLAIGRLVNGRWRYVGFIDMLHDVDARASYDDDDDDDD